MTVIINLREFYYVDDLILIEPWREFEVVDAGIHRPKEHISIVPLRMVDSELIYCPEIVPNLSTYAVLALKERIDDANAVEKMLKILASHPFDTECKRFSYLSQYLNLVSGFLRHLFSSSINIFKN